MNHAQLQPLPPTAVTPERILGDQQFQSAWDEFLRIGLEPGCMHGPEAVTGSETGYISLAGDVSFEGDEFAAAIESPAVVKCPTPAITHRIVNDGDLMADLLVVSVSLSEQQQQSCTSGFGLEVVDATKLKARPAIHGGCGAIATRHIWTPDDFASSWTFVDHAVLAPQSSVGYHHHGGLEESFVILKGRGLMTIDGETFEVTAGSVTFQGMEQGHGIYNPEAEPLAFLRIAVGVPDEEFTTIDLDDDLASRQQRGLHQS